MCFLDVWDVFCVGCFLDVWDVFCVGCFLGVWAFWVFGMFFVGFGIFGCLGCVFCVGCVFWGVGIFWGLGIFGWDVARCWNFWLGCWVGFIPWSAWKKKIKAPCAFQKVMFFLLGFHHELLKKMLVLFEPIPDKYCRCVLKRSQFLWGKFTFNDWISENTSLRKVHSPKREGNEKQISWLIFNGQSTTPTHVPPLEIRPY